jgi:hypothetical protein
MLPSKAGAPVQWDRFCASWLPAGIETDATVPKGTANRELIIPHF